MIVHIILSLILVVSSSSHSVKKDVTEIDRIISLGDLTKIKQLVQAGNNIDTLLHSAVQESKKEVAESLIEQGAQVNSPNKDGDTPLHIVAALSEEPTQTEIHEKEALIKMLLKKGALLDIPNSDGLLPFHIAAQYRNTNALNLFLGHHPQLVISGPDAHGNTVLHYAVNMPQLVDTMISAGASVNAQNNERRTPLHEAVKHGCINTIKILMSHGADQNSVDINGRSPRMDAIAYGNREVLNALGIVFLPPAAQINDLYPRQGRGSAAICGILFLLQFMMNGLHNGAKVSGG